MYKEGTPSVHRGWRGCYPSLPPGRGRATPHSVRSILNCSDYLSAITNKHRMKSHLGSREPINCVMGLFSVSDPEHDPIIQYQFWDSNPAATSGHFAINGAPQGANQAIEVSAAQVNQTGFVAGSVPGVDQIWERAFDGSLWSNWHMLSVTGHA